MFQPQPTPYLPFASFGVTAPISEFAFQPSAGLVVDNSGPTVFRDPLFSPIASNFSNNSNNNNPHLYQKMESNDFAAQEALARDFQPALEVGCSSTWPRQETNAHTTSGSSGGGEAKQPCHH